MPNRLSEKNVETVQSFQTIQNFAKKCQNIVKTSFIKQTFHRISKTTQKTKPIIQNTKLQSVPVNKTTVFSHDFS